MKVISQQKFGSLQQWSWASVSYMVSILLFFDAASDPLQGQVKNSPANAGDMGSIPGWGRSPGGGNGITLQYSCWENPMDRET